MTSNAKYGVNTSRHIKVHEALQVLPNISPAEAIGDTVDDIRKAYEELKEEQVPVPELERSKIGGKST